MHAWSSQQEAVISYFVDKDGNLIVRARAGTGKTTTIVGAVKEWLAANPDKTAVVCAFNKSIERELNKRFKDVRGVEVKTLHGIGFAACRLWRDGLKVEDAKKVLEEGGVLRKDKLAREVCSVNVPDAILRLVAKLHTLGREVTPHAKNRGDLVPLAIQHDCQPDASWGRMGFDLDYVEQRALEAMDLASKVESGDTIDYADMIFLPCRNGWLAAKWDLCVVDEAQDMTNAQLEVAVGSVREGGRTVVVGDDRQGIYTFRGADAGSLDRLKASLGAAELGLTVTYRCGRAIVEAAQSYVPDFEAGSENPDGLISRCGVDEVTRTAGPGDFILSRTNAPLIPIAIKLLRAGKRARVAGKDIGKDLATLVRRFKARTVPELLRSIEGWANREVARQQAAMAAATNGRRKAFESKIELIRDQADMLNSLVTDAKNLDEVYARVEFLFVDNENIDGMGRGSVITCSSVHKAKGLEADRVFILADTLRTGTIEEENIAYVAITRAKRELVWVDGAAQPPSPWSGQEAGVL